ncbi:MAG: DUF1295 domain-containing protein [Cyanobacteria bacterium P01_H01_bin.74]
MSPFWMPPLLLWAGIFTTMTLLWALSYKFKNAGIVDVFWGYFILPVTTFYWLITPVPAPDFSAGFPMTNPHVLFSICVVLSGLRLGTYLLDRFLKEWPVEDARYTRFREDWKNSGQNAELMMWLAYQLQGLLMLLISVPVYLVFSNPATPVSPMQSAAAVVMVFAVVCEALSDEQLRQFKANPANKGTVCQAGFWNYSRHPNYFFQWLFWVGVFVFVLPYPWGWTMAYVPLLMLHFLINVTGIAATEARLLQSRGEPYRQYQETTSPFIPFFKKKVAS